MIGITGVARAGKDTLCNYFLKTYPKCQRLALADELKKDLDAFLIEKVGISAFTKDTEEKKLIRDLLVAYGKIQRARTQGKYWTGLIQPKILTLKKEGFLPIVTDVRYAIYAEDEYQWLKNNNGMLIHVKRVQPDGTPVLPPNQDERINDPILEKLADYRVVWPTVISNDESNLDVSKYVQDQLKNLLAQI